MKELKGTERQIKFATDIRNYVIYQVEGFEKLDKTKVERFIKALSNQGSAKFIIDSFVNNFKNKRVRAIALDYFEYENLAKITQKELKVFNNRWSTINELEQDLPFETQKLEKKEKVAEVKKEVKYWSIAQREQIEKLINDISGKPDLYSEEFKKFKVGDNLTNEEAESLIDSLKKLEKPKSTVKGPRYFTAKFDGFDCETGEVISPGDLCVKVGDGIILAHNY